MKFQCENCGRSYLAGEDVRGRAFRMRCKQCGHVIVVKPEAGAAPVAPELVQTGQPALAVAKPAPPAEPPHPMEAPAPNAAELLQSAALAGWTGEASRRAKFDPFVDDPPWANGKAHANGKANGTHDVQVPAIPAIAEARDEAEAAFAALEAELAGEERGAVATSPALAGSDGRPVSVSTAAGVLPTEDEAKLGPVELGPVSARRKLPSTRAGLAVLLALGAGAFLLLRSPRPSAATPQASQASQAGAAASPSAGAGSDGAAPVPARAAPVAPAQAPPAAPRPVEPHPAQKHAKPKEPALAHVLEAIGSVPASAAPPAAATAAPQAQPSGKVAPEPAATGAPAEPGEPAAVDRPRPSDPKVIADTVQRYAGLFRACATDAASDEPQLDVAGRRVELILTVNPNGRALYPTLDDVQLGETRLGRCLKDAGKKLQFPPFDGPSERVHVPLTLER